MVVGFSFLELSAFWNVGDTVKRKVFSHALCEQALEEVKELGFKPIFRKVYAKRLDPFREQVSIEVLDDGVSSIHAMVAGLVEGANNLCEVNVSTWHALKSTPGGRTQAVHQDYPQFEISRALLKHKLVQGSVIVALMKNTLLHVYPRCFVKRKKNAESR
ncbi:hypothetical protein PHYSODRAFT_502480 [Phytophthora sojae]|uniref:Uncharacterized protein n=1 Tax=Phytophthora sojae (strain P6497) TaxID=1094619 RepID=G4ZG46_PHYSP|nr:hypothetical protein PHYSODRAFT_502480 [Phytophthora sojae]EGZ17530.1 hypothetical protein PHYSODRAFT_502480 [Phytophthora sojae]|eukprot:XP_009526588.1 hypothetical protein PHYSODRAFT_502480 [Phytophthora sojae]